jgi:hypothetical protein
VAGFVVHDAPCFENAMRQQPPEDPSGGKYVDLRSHLLKVVVLRLRRMICV